MDLAHLRELFPKEWTKRVSIRTIVLLLLLVTAAKITSQMGQLIEDVQLVAFPLLALLLYCLPIYPARNLPKVLFCLALGCWGIATLRGFEAFGTSEFNGRVVLARFEEDREGLQARDLFQRFNQIARTYDLPPVKLLQLKVATHAAGLHWLSEHPEALFLLWGRTEWFRATFPSGVKSYQALLQKKREYDVFRDEPQTPPVKLEFLNPGEALELNIPPYGSVKIVVLPEFLSVPAEPSELSRHLLAWIGSGLKSAVEASELEPSQAIEEKRDAFYEASLIHGAWKSDAPRALARFLLGSIDLIEAEQSDSATPLLEAIARLERARAGLVLEDEPALYAAVLNNLGAAYLLRSAGERDLSQARRAFQQASNAYSFLPGGRGVRAALENLLMLDQSGYTPQ